MTDDELRRELQTRFSEAEAQKLAAQEAKVSDLVKALVNVPLDSHIGRC